MATARKPAPPPDPPGPPDPGKALTSGDHRQALEALRDVLAGHLLIAEPNVSAQIAGRLQAVLTELAAMPAGTKVSAKDEIKAARDRRRAS